MEAQLQERVRVVKSTLVEAETSGRRDGGAISRRIMKQIRKREGGGVGEDKDVAGWGERKEEAIVMRQLQCR